MPFLNHSIRHNPHLSSRIKSLLYALCSYANAEGICYPSQETLALATGLSVRTIRRALTEAIELQLVEVCRRWYRSNSYRLTCIQKPKLSTMRSQCPINSEQPTDLRNNVSNVCKKRYVQPQEIGLLLNDIGEVVGYETSERNHRWYRKLIRLCTYESLQDALSFVRRSVLEGDVLGNQVRNPSGLMLWYLRKQGLVPI